MLDWLACKVTREPDFFERLPDVLQDWVRYAGRRRALPAEAVIQVADAVAEHRSEMLETVTRSGRVGTREGLDDRRARGRSRYVSDREQVDAFIERYNNELAS